MSSNVINMMNSNVTAMMAFSVTSKMNSDLISTNGSYANGTRPGRTENQQYLMGVLQTLSVVIVIVIMFGVGCSLQPKTILKYLKRPKEFITGTCLQLIGMPLVGLAITQILSMNTPEAMGVLIQSIAPGGAYSNLITYWMDGDMNLSVVMTGTSTILAFGSMSFWSLIISKILTLERQFLIPYKSIGIIAAETIGPLIIGTILRHFFAKIAPKITKICSIIGSIFIVASFILNGVAGAYDNRFSYKIYLAAVLLITIAVLFGYLASRVPCLNLEPSCRRTIAIETAFQNTPVAFSIIVLSFSSADPEIFGPTVFFPVLHGVLLGSLSGVAAIMYKILKAKGVKCVSPI